MIKISKENIDLRRIFGVGMIVVQIGFIVFAIAGNFWLFYLLVSYAILSYAFIAKGWRYLLIVDVFLNNNFTDVLFKTSKGEFEFKCNSVISCTTRYGIADVLVVEDGKEYKFYFVPNSQKNLRYFDLP